MAILKCKMCGGEIELSADKTFGTCDSCGSTMTFPKVDDEQRANMFNRGNHFRRAGEFDKALAVYERIVQEDENDAEAHWCCALCRFGIEYVEDPNTFEYLPTCHRASFDSFLEDVDYLAALEHSDGITRRQYQKDAAKIAEVQRGILATSQNEEPFDVFICYKESENDGTRTRDSLMAQEIYYQLTEQGRRVFFSRITLEDKAGTEYEPYIFAALNSAKVMILVTTSAEHVNAVWVKNEWSRFLSLMRKDRSKLLLPCYRDMDPYDLPEALSVLQSYDMGKIGFIQDLTRGVNKVLDAAAPKTKETVKETVVVQQGNANAAPLLKRAFMFLEDGDWNSANEYCEKVLDIDPENAEAYLGKLMMELRVKKRDDLKNQTEPFDNRNNYQKAIRFGNNALKKELSESIAFIKDRNETSRKEGIYQNALRLFREHSYVDAAAEFGKIPGYKDAKDKKAESEKLAEEARKDRYYALAEKAAAVRSIESQQEAIDIWKSVAGWKDADARIVKAQQTIDELKAEAERECQERERQMKEAVIAAQKRKKKTKKAALIIVIALALIATALIILFTVILPAIHYSKAMELYNAGQYEEAIVSFEALNGYRESETRTLDCRYWIAKDYYATGKYEEAITVFETLNGYKDSAAQIEACQTAIKDQEYDAAVALYNAGQYEKAVVAFKALNGYRDSATQIDVCETAIKDREYDAAVALYNVGHYEKAITAFEALNGYEDSTEQIEKCYIAKYGSEGYQVIKGLKVGDSFVFGEYEQDNNESNGKEEIEWIVLDREDNKILIISKYALDYQQYNKVDTDNITWENSSVREWMNGSFINNAFNNNEQECIIISNIVADTNSLHGTSSGNNTADKAFLLNASEANQYFKSDEERRCAPTDYVISKGAKTCDLYDIDLFTKDGKRTCLWWLRTAGFSQEYAAQVSFEGTVILYGSLVYTMYPVRPALWVDLDEFLSNK